jgi:Nucleotidyl transferase AbiEii toxin, Type IV TA system
MTTSVPCGQESLALTDFQVQVAQLFFSLPAASGFLLAGGAALVAQHLTTRPTQDLDLFTHSGGTDVPAARDGLEAAARNEGRSTERIRDEATLRRLIIHGNDNLLIDLALDSPPGQPVTASLIGPTFAREELAGRKVLALLDRAEARDFADVFERSEHTSPRRTYCTRPPGSIRA